MAIKLVSYLRVSTSKQGRSGLGLEAQREAVERHAASVGGRIVAEYVEVESGKRANRPQLEAALAACRLHRATLLIAKLDRLSRNAAFLLNLRDAGVKFQAADMPDANEMVVGIMAVVAQNEARMISERTKAALTAAKARGTLLGQAGRHNLANRLVGSVRGAEARTAKANTRAQDLSAVIAELRKAGAVSLERFPA
ncbi:recombinase family protein [Roseomonas sp. M0104]|uniref:Recombinase family protein n=1 Tax=Teichococcus coralli TaxID=2545983 RepID=A0A845BF16_9PROT|nr:recombinase family protein [Pseudoroseomonas coralli]MXP66153.1 recombinase family protein [Pseudoroseomonas coralli]